MHQYNKDRIILSVFPVFYFEAHKSFFDHNVTIPYILTKTGRRNLREVGLAQCVCMCVWWWLVEVEWYHLLLFRFKDELLNELLTCFGFLVVFIRLTRLLPQQPSSSSEVRGSELS